MENYSVITITILVILLIWSTWLTLKVKRLGGWLKNPGTNLNKESLPDMLKLDKEVQELYEINSRASKITKRSICKVGITRFNALEEKSGNQSFSLAMLDCKDNGIIISSLQTRQGGRFFIRAVREGQGVEGYQLLPEETKALERAKQVVF